MRGRRLIALIVAAAGAATAVRVRRRRLRSTVELHYDDGSMIALEEGTPAADRLLALARSATVAARPA